MDSQSLTIVTIIVAITTGIVIPIAGFIVKGIKKSIEKLWEVKDKQSVEIDQVEAKLQLHEMDRKLHPGEESLQSLREFFEVQIKALGISVQEIKEMLKDRK